MASLLLRLSVGGMFFIHGFGKLFIVGMHKVNEGFVAHGFPVWTNYMATAIEMLGGLMLLLGLYTRLGCVLLMPVTIGIMVYHFPNGWVFHKPGGGWEYPQLILMALWTLFFLGGGKYALKK
ncbi:MAG: DoxX family membrane protein [Bacteroidota bacterium]